MSRASKALESALLATKAHLTSIIVDKLISACTSTCLSACLADSLPLRLSRQLAINLVDAAALARINEWLFQERAKLLARKAPSGSRLPDTRLANTLLEWYSLGSLLSASESGRGSVLDMHLRFRRGYRSGSWNMSCSSHTSLWSAEDEARASEVQATGGTLLVRFTGRAAGEECLRFCCSLRVL